MLGNQLGEESVNAIVNAAKDKPQIKTLCGLKPDQTEANFKYNSLGVGDAILLAWDLRKNSALVSLEYAAAPLDVNSQ